MPSIINDATNNDILFDPTVNGNVMSRGYDEDQAARSLAASPRRLGYHVLPFRIRSCCIGHDHRRERLFMLAESSDSYCERPQGVNWQGVPLWFAGRACCHAVRNPQDVLPQPRVCGADNGISNRMDRLRGLGNAVDVCVGERIGKAIFNAYYGGLECSQAAT